MALFKILFRLMGGGLIVLLTAAWNPPFIPVDQPENLAKVPFTRAQTPRMANSMNFREPIFGDSNVGQSAHSDVNLIPIIRNFYVDTAVFSESSKDVQDGCVSEGEHRLLRFDTLVYNTGDQDLDIGSPADRPEKFVWSAGHGHYHLIGFLEYQLFNSNYQEITDSYKQAICFFDSLRISDEARRLRQFSPGNCNTEQGLSAGWADLYRSSIPCQFIVIDEVTDGYFAITATANAQGDLLESNYQDNTTCRGLLFNGNRVTETSSRFCLDLEILQIDPDLLTPEMTDVCRIDLRPPCRQ